MIIRDAVIEDLTAIIEIYNATVPGRMATADMEPIPVEQQGNWFRSHNPRRNPIWVADVNGKVAGWISFERFYGRPAYAGTYELSIYLREDFQRQGIASHLIEQAIERAPSFGLHTLLAFIFAHNIPSVRLFEKFAFQHWGFLPKVAVLDAIYRDVVILGREVIKKAG